MVGGDVARLVVLGALHGDIALDRCVPLLLLVAKLKRRVRVGAAVDQVRLGIHLGSLPKFVGLDFGLLVFGGQIHRGVDLLVYYLPLVLALVLVLALSWGRILVHW